MGRGLGRPLSLICLDAAIVGHILIPKSSRAAAQEIEASAELIRSLVDGRLSGVAPAILIAEAKWLIGRAAQGNHLEYIAERVDEVEDLLPQSLGSNFKFVNIDMHLSSLAADYRLKYYSRTNAFSYNDGLYLATAVLQNADYLVTTDPHLLKAEEIKVITPSEFMKLSI